MADVVRLVHDRGLRENATPSQLQQASVTPALSSGDHEKDSDGAGSSKAARTPVVERARGDHFTDKEVNGAHPDKDDEEDRGQNRNIQPVGKARPALATVLRDYSSFMPRHEGDMAY